MDVTNSEGSAKYQIPTDKMPCLPKHFKSFQDNATVDIKFEAYPKPISVQLKNDDSGETENLDVQVIKFIKLYYRSTSR